MAVIKVNKLGGIYPSVLPRNLPDDAAQVAENLLARTTEFRPLQVDSVAATSATNNPKTLYRLARKADGSFNSDLSTGWRTHAGHLNYVKGQVNDEATERTYYTYMDGLTPPRATNALGADRPLGVPSPLTKLTAAVTEVYTFTPEIRSAEIEAVMQQAVRLVLETAPVRTLVGLADALPAVGWIQESDVSSDPEAEKFVLRIFAVNPTTNAIIDTYSAMPVAEANWVLDPVLGGFYATKPVGYTAPAWASAHSKWWCIRVRGFATAFDIAQAALDAALDTLKMPGTQGADPLLTPADVTEVVARIVELADKDSPAVADKIKRLYTRQQDLANMFQSGGAATLVEAIKAFYAKSEINNAIESAKADYAEKIWRYVEMIGTATAAPWYGGN